VSLNGQLRISIISALGQSLQASSTLNGDSKPRSSPQRGTKASIDWCDQKTYKTEETNDTHGWGVRPYIYTVGLLAHVGKTQISDFGHLPRHRSFDHALGPDLGLRTLKSYKVEAKGHRRHTSSAMADVDFGAV